MKINNNRNFNYHAIHLCSAQMQSKKGDKA